MSDLEKLANFIETILDQSTSNEITVSISKDKDDFVTIVIADSLSEICSTYEPYAEQALKDAFEQTEQFVDGLS